MTNLPHRLPHCPVPLRLESLSIGKLAAASLEVAPGEVVCLSGRSGSGKSRLLRAVADLEAHGGKVWLGDVEQASLPAHQWRRSVMMVPAESQWWFDRAGDHFTDGGPPSGLAALGLDPEVMDWPVSRLSSGEKQRLALLRALSLEPAALLLDEPTANLDAEAVGKVEQWLLALVREHRLPVLWVAHDQGQIERVADRHYALDGHLLHRGGRNVEDL